MRAVVAAQPFDTSIRYQVSKQTRFSRASQLKIREESSTVAPFSSAQPPGCCFWCRVEHINIPKCCCSWVPCRTGRRRRFPGLFIQVLTMTPVDHGARHPASFNRPFPAPVCPISLPAIFGQRDNFHWLIVIKKRQVVHGYT